MPDPVSVSVIIAAWSAEKTLGRAIDSVLTQNVSVEVIVIDDASVDATAAVAQAKANEDPRVQLIRQPENRGPSDARNRGLAQARGTWVTVLDADDFFCEPDRLARLIEIAEAERADFVADDLWKVPEAAPDGPRSAMISDDPIGIQHLDAATFVRGNLSSKHGGRREYGFLKPLMSRAFLQRHRLEYVSGIRLGEDFVLYTHALILGARFVLTDAAGYAAVVRPNSLSGQHPTAAHEHLVAADQTLLSLPEVDPDTRAALNEHMLEQHKKWAWRKLIDAKGAADLKAALACFWAPPAVVADLLSKLWGEVRQRLSRRLSAK